MRRDCDAALAEAVVRGLLAGAAAPLWQRLAYRRAQRLSSLASRAMYVKHPPLLFHCRHAQPRFCSGFGPAHRGFGPAHRTALVVPQQKLRSFCYCGLGRARRPLGRTSTWRSPENAFRTLWGLFLVCMFGPPAVRTTACDASFGTAEGRNTAQRRQWSF